eukprot:1286590-Prymnesium_polylepis.1
MCSRGRDRWIARNYWKYWNIYGLWAPSKPSPYRRSALIFDLKFCAALEVLRALVRPAAAAELAYSQ